MRKLAIIGYGKMGKLIEQLAPEYDFEVALKLDEFNNANGSGLTAACRLWSAPPAGWINSQW